MSADASWQIPRMERWDHISGWANPLLIIVQKRKSRRFSGNWGRSKVQNCTFWQLSNPDFCASLLSFWFPPKFSTLGLNLKPDSVQILGSCTFQVQFAKAGKERTVRYRWQNRISNSSQGFENSNGISKVTVLLWNKSKRMKIRSCTRPVRKLCELWKMIGLSFKNLNLNSLLLLRPL